MQINTLVMDPNDSSTLYCGTNTSRGVWKYDDGGGTWEINGLDGSNILSLAIKPDSSVVFAGTLRDVVKRRDSTGWNACLGSPPSAQALAIDPNHPTTIYAGSLDSSDAAYGVWVSYNSGNTWERMSAGLPGEGTMLQVQSIVVGPSSSMDSPQMAPLYAAVVHNGDNDQVYGIYKRSPRETTWAPSSSGIPFTPGVDGVLSIIQDAHNPDLLFAGGANGQGTYRSEDGGTTWMSMHGPPNQTETPAIILTLAWDMQTTTLHAGTKGAGVFEGCDFSCNPKVPPTARASCDVSFTMAVPTRCMPYTIKWHFGDGGESDLLDPPPHQYAVGGTYNWSVTGTAGGRVITKTGTIVVSPLAISGYVTLKRTTTTVSGVTLKATLGGILQGTATTGTEGEYRIDLPAGTYTITPSSPYYYFFPASDPDLSIGCDVPMQDEISFQAYPKGSCTIEGYAKICNNPPCSEAELTDPTAADGAQVILAGWPDKIATWDASGKYTFTSLASGENYVVVPSIRNCKTFSPARLDVLNLQGNVSIPTMFIATPNTRCLPCFGDFNRDMTLCNLSAPCLETARSTFSRCLIRQTQEASAALYNATLLAISVSRHDGKPTPESVPLTIAEEGDYFINLLNGDQTNKETMASSATVDIDPFGRVFGPNDIKQSVPFLVRGVHLMPGNYTLTVEVRSNPGSYLAVIVSNVDFSTLP